MPHLESWRRRIRAWLLCAAATFLLAAARGADWQAGPGHRWQTLPAVPGHAPGFTRLDGSFTGITFTNDLAESRWLTNRNLLSGAGVALGDVDGDGRCDIFFCGLDRPDQLYLNLGDWHFTNSTATAFAGAAARSALGNSTGAAFADIDGDGDLDLLVNTLGHGTHLFVNDGHGHFSEATAAAGLATQTGATSLALADVDGDGDLDLYVANFRPTTIMDEPSAHYRMQVVNGQPRVLAFNGRPVTEPDLTNRFIVTANGQVQECGEADVLWRNDTPPGGAPRFVAVPWTEGAFLDESGKALSDAVRDWGLACRFGDLNGDGLVDLYVCNDLWTPDRVWLNTRRRPGEIRFQAVSPLAVRANSTFSMGVDFGDLNRDGNTDFFTVDMLSRFHTNRQTQLAGMSPVARFPGRFNEREQVQRNCLQLGRGDGTYAETAWQSGVAASEWSWGPVFLDVDLDGYEDILITNGQWRDFQDSDGAERLQAAQRGGRTLTSAEIAALVRSFPNFATPNVAFHNRGAAAAGFVPRFDEVGVQWGFAASGVSQGAALADLDGDGDLDVVMNNLMEAPGLYRNEAAGARVAVQLKGRAGNQQGIGAAVVLRWMGAEAKAGGLPREQRVDFIAGGRYLAGDEARRTFAAAVGESYELEVTWPDGRRSVVSGVSAGRLYELSEPDDAPVPAAPTRNGPSFVDVTAALNHRHVDEDFSDAGRQPLIPRRLSSLGPGVTWADVNADGHDDLLVATGKGGRLAVLVGDGQGGFRSLDEPPFNRVQGRDLTTVLSLHPGMLFAGVANYEDGQTNGGCVAIFDSESKRAGTSLSGQLSSVGPLAAADVDGDGTLEIFAGGRVIAGRYPEPATSLLLGTAGGRLTVQRRFESLGLVSGACFSDLNGDGRPELALATEWGPLQVFRNVGGVLEPWDVPVTSARSTDPRKLSGYSGLWNSIIAGDFDGDGQMDLVAGNWGANTRVSQSADFSADPAPARLWYGDLAGQGGGVMDIFESSFAGGREVPARELMAVRALFPQAAEKVPSFAAYARMSLSELFGDALGQSAHVDAQFYDSILLLNRGDHFELRRLPDQVQLAPVYGLAVGDADGDGREDVFVAQGFFAVDPFRNRADAGRGVWLYGDGQGGFRPDLLSGVAVYGEARGAALADFDEDGRVDLCVAQNGAATTLWRNTAAQPGLRLTLEGTAENPGAVGAAVRLRWGGAFGPWRERHAGAGYWSSDSPVLVLGGRPGADAVEVRWPGGRLTTHALPVGAKRLTVRAPGP